MDEAAAVRPFRMEISQAELDDLRGWSEFDRGGHFAAMEEPDLLVGDVREFFRPLR